MVAFFLKIANRFREIYWRIFKPKSFGVRVLVINNGRILLVRHHYCKGFYLPGGGVKKGEIPSEAAKREISEECGLLLENIELLGEYANDHEGKKDTITLFLAKIEDGVDPKPGWEIKFCNYFSFGTLPANISPGTVRRIEEYKNNKFKGGVW
ncbi:MAG: NUDIX domain-containing protein [Candidatus Paceibacterota bacterium]|jgi:ADP-ribose pyrophosphatase YjhB (NUDIX family)